LRRLEPSTFEYFCKNQSYIFTPVDFLNSRVNLKFKSIKKPFQIDADLCIGIIRGKSKASGLNLEKIKRSAERFNFAERNFWVVNLAEKEVCKPVLGCGGG
jgi:hypothetical protein